MPSAENSNVLWKLTHAGWSGQPYLETFLYYPKYKPGSHMGESLREAAKTWKRSQARALEWYWSWFHLGLRIIITLLKNTEQAQKYAHNHKTPNIIIVPKILFQVLFHMLFTSIFPVPLGYEGQVLLSHFVDEGAKAQSSCHTLTATAATSWVFRRMEHVLWGLLEDAILCRGPVLVLSSFYRSQGE